MTRQFEANPNETTDDLLQQISTGAANAMNPLLTMEAIPPFAALLVKLSKEAAESASKVEKMTSTLINLTWALLVLTLGLFILTLVLILGHG